MSGIDTTRKCNFVVFSQHLFFVDKKLSTVETDNMTTPLRVLGIDPGSRVTGFGILEERGQTVVYLDSGTIDVSRLPLFTDRLHKIYEEIQKIVSKHQPKEAAIEAPFVQKNVQSALKLGKTVGAITLALLSQKISVVEYAPRLVKQSIVGYGNAEKEQVQFMIASLVGAPRDSSLDAMDALAVAWCHLQQIRIKNMLTGSSRDFTPYRESSQ